MKLFAEDPPATAQKPNDGGAPGGWAKAAVLLLLVLGPIIFNAIELRSELTVPLPSLNDDAFHFLLIQRASEALASGQSPFDPWAPELDFGFPQILYYQHLPHLTVVFLHRLLLKQVDLLTLIDVIRYLLLIGLPLTVYWSMRQLGFPLMAGAVGAACVTLVSGNYRYGFEYESYIWKGWGMYTQLWAVHLCFIVLACVDRLLERGRGYVSAILACSALALSHLMYSYMIAPGVLVLFLVGMNRANLRQRLARLVITAACALVITAYFWFPFLRLKAYLNPSPYEPEWKYGSFGAQSILTWLVNGDLLDYGRLPVLTLLLALGVACAVLARTRPAKLAVGLSLVWLALFFGRPTWGSLLDHLPLHERIHFHRFIGGVDLAAILLIGLGGEWLRRQLTPVPVRWRGAVASVIVLGILVPAVWERHQVFAHNAQTMEQTKAILDSDEDARAILAALAGQPPGRAYAGRRDAAHWGTEMRIGGLYFFDLLTFDQIPAITPYESQSLNSDLVWHMNEENPAHYNLFNVRYVVAPRSRRMPAFLRPIKETRRYVLYRADTSGYTEFATVAGTISAASPPALLAQNVGWLASVGATGGSFLRYDYPAGSPLAAGPANAATEGPAPAGCPAGGHIEEERVLPNRFDLRVDCPVASTVVLKVSYHPNWQVAIDEQDVRPFMLSPSFIGMTVPAGVHHVRAEYRSAAFKTALLLLAGVALVAMVLLGKRFDALDALFAARSRPAGSPVPLSSIVVTEPAQGEGAGVPAVSVVIPAYNEAQRILPYLEAIEGYFTRRGESYEVLVVDDGSRDRTADVVRELALTRPWLRLVHYEQNRGKGHAVRTGMLAARGALRLMADADGATPIEEIERLRARMPADGRAVVVGSRAMPDPDVRRVVKRHRQVIGEVFSALKRILLGVRVRDSQCGFKLFTAPAAEALFGAARLDGFAFDVEILYLAAKASIPVTEVAVNWHDVGASRVQLLSDPLKMARDVWRIRRLHRHAVLAPAGNSQDSAAAKR